MLCVLAAVGYVVLAVGLARSGLVGKGVAVLVGLGGVGTLLTMPGPLKPLLVFAALVLLAGQALVVRAVGTETTNATKPDWEPVTVSRSSSKGVVRLADERRRRAVRVTGSEVNALPPSGGARLRVATLDISRGAVRLPIGEGGWTYDDPLDLVVHLGDTKSINVVGRMLRVDEETKSVVLGFDYLPAHDAEALDRFALTQLSPSTAGAPPAHDPAHPR